MENEINGNNYNNNKENNYIYDRKQTNIHNPPLYCFNQIFFFLTVLCKLGWKRKSHFLIRIMSCLSFHVIFQSLSRNLMLHSSLSYCKAVNKNIVIGSHKRFLIVAHISITDGI